MFKNAQVKDRVWCFEKGWGSICTKLTGATTFDVIFDDGSSCLYTLTGQQVSCRLGMQTLFWNEFEIPKEAFIKPLPKLEKDTKVLVWDDEAQQKRRRYS